MQRHIETVGQRNAARTERREPVRPAATNPQEEEAQRAHDLYMGLPEIEKQRLRWEEKERDPLLMKAAARIIHELVPVDFDSEELEQKYGIFRNYFEAAALRTGYKNASPADAFRLGSRFRYLPDPRQAAEEKKRKIQFLERLHDQAVGENIEILGELQDFIEANKKLEARLKKAQAALAEERKINKKNRPAATVAGRKKSRKNSS